MSTERYDKLRRYCIGGTKELQASILAAEDKVAAVISCIKPTKEKLIQLKSGLAGSQAGCEGTNGGTAKAMAIREK